jgi:anhydro-N-acetylmuramic acid kinase
MSGTSHDAVGAVGADIMLQEDNVRVHLVGQLSRSYPEWLRAELIAANVELSTGGAENFDRDSVRAERGQVDDELLKTLLVQPYYRAAPPSPPARFNRAYLESVLRDRAIPADDIVATVTALTAHAIADALAPFGRTEVIASGVGTRNPTLMSMLREQLRTAELCTSDQLGLSSAAKEAAAFAVPGFLTAHGLPGTHPAYTGAKRATVLGSITPGTAGLDFSAARTAPLRLTLAG